MGVTIMRISVLVLTALACSFESTAQVAETPMHETNARSAEKQKAEALSDSVYLHTGWYYVLESKAGVARELDRTSEVYWIDPSPIVVAGNIVKFDLYKATFNGVSSWGLAMQLDSSGTSAWSIATDHSVGHQLAFIVDNQLISTPKVNSEINFGMTALNRGIYSKGELKAFKKTIKSNRN